MPLLIFVAVAAWFVFGDPPRTIAKWIWPDEPAPWETVDAFFYPDRNDLSVHELAEGLSSLDECRQWARNRAIAIGDIQQTRSDYECGLGEKEPWEGFLVYRNTVR